MQNMTEPGRSGQFLKARVLSAVPVAVSETAPYMLHSVLHRGTPSDSLGEQDSTTRRRRHTGDRSGVWGSGVGGVLPPVEVCCPYYCLW